MNGPNQWVFGQPDSYPIGTIFQFCQDDGFGDRLNWSTGFSQTKMLIQVPVYFFNKTGSVIVHGQMNFILLNQK